MSFRPAELLARLTALEASAPRPSRYIVAFSGGLDSSVLLHALADKPRQQGPDLLAVHVDHQLSPASGDWAQHCRRFAEDRGIDCVIETVVVEDGGDGGPEAAARDARYRALARHVADGDWLLSAHHADDQAETLLLNLLRGSGPAGVAGIPALRRFGRGWLARPLLEVTRETLEAYAGHAGLEWIEDPANEDDRFDRNFLRRNVLSELATRWPNAGERLARSAALAREADDLLGELADADIDAAGGEPTRLEIAALGRLSAARCRNVLRRAIRRAGLPAPPSGRLESIVTQLLFARADARPVVCWAGAEARRYRGRLYLMSGIPEAGFDGLPLGKVAVPLGPGLGNISLEAGTGAGLSPRLGTAGLTLRQRRGGEKIKPVNQASTRPLKKLLQEKGVVPWMRDLLPLVYAGDRLVAVADLWIAAEAAAEPGLVLRWSDRPAID